MVGLSAGIAILVCGGIAAAEKARIFIPSPAVGIAALTAVKEDEETEKERTQTLDATLDALDERSAAGAEDEANTAEGLEKAPPRITAPARIVLLVRDFILAKN
jgi:hypothetical protein